jgi:probable rRNA maturation factor
MISIFVTENYQQLVDESLLSKTASTVLLRENISTSIDLSIVIDDDMRIQALNREFRGIDSPTDVLSFPADAIDPDTNQSYLGDIIISYPQAERQAQSARHPVMNEMQLLVVHGVLHLLGHDHADTEQHARMWAVQQSILDQLGVVLGRIPGDE